MDMKKIDEITYKPQVNHTTGDILNYRIHSHIKAKTTYIITIYEVIDGNIIEEVKDNGN